MTRLIVYLMLLVAGVAVADGQTAILGASQVSAEAMYRYVNKRNPEFTRDIAEAFHEVGARYGIKGDIAFCQAIIETGWFRFNGGTAVTPDQHNYCGLGVERRGHRGCSFETAAEGVAAFMQHLFAYCSTEPLPVDEVLLDPRFNFIERGTAPCWEDLSGKWAMNPRYGDTILDLYRRMAREAGVAVEEPPAANPYFD